MTAADQQFRLRLEQVAIALADRQLLQVEAEIGGGEILTIMGPSGSGKSSLLAYVAGFLDPVFSATGQIYLGEREIAAQPPHRRNVGLLFQEALLFPHMSVGLNLVFAIPHARRPRARRHVIAREALEAAGMADYFDADPATLSGGQKTRAALMRVLLSEPAALLLDEPFSGLDADRRVSIREFVFSEIRARGLPAILVTHDIEDAQQAGGRVIEIG